MIGMALFPKLRMHPKDLDLYLYLFPMSLTGGYYYVDCAYLPLPLLRQSASLTNKVNLSREWRMAGHGFNARDLGWPKHFHN